MFTLPLKIEPEWYRAKNCIVLAAYWQRLLCNVGEVRVLSIFDLKGGTSGSASRDIRTLLMILIDHGN